MEERNRMRSIDDIILNPRTKADSSSSGGGGGGSPHSNDDRSDHSTEGGRRLRHHQSPRADFDTEVIFENVCLPSPILSYRSTPSGRRKTLPTASPLTARRGPREDKPLKNTETPQRGLGAYRPEVGFNSSSRGELAGSADLNTRFRGMIDAPHVEHYDVEPAAARGATISPPRDVINQDAALVAIGRRRTRDADRSDEEEDIASTQIDCSSGSRCDAKTTQTNAANDANVAAAAGRCKTDANDAVGHLSSRRSTATTASSTESMNSQQQQQQQQQSPVRLLLVTDLDAFLEDDPPHTRTTSASIDGHLIPNSSSSSSNVGQQLQFSSSSHPHPHPHPAAGEVIWELSGRKLSNLCQTLITDCGRFTDGQTELPDDAPVASAIAASVAAAAAAAAAAAVDETRHLHGHKKMLVDDGCKFGEIPMHGNSKPSTRSNTSLFGDNRLTSDGSMETDPSPDLLHYSPYVHNSNEHHWNSGIDAYTVDLTRQTSEGSFDIRSIPASPLRFAPRGNTSSVSSSSVAPLTDAATRGQSVATSTHGAAGKVSLETAIDSDDEVFADHNKGSSDRLVEDRSPEDAKGSGRRDENNSSVSSSRSAGRRGRTMERGKYDASLLKDFIKPEFKKFSLPPSSQDLDLDTELAIWELSDFVPDRHQSAPPTDTTMQVAKSDDLLLLRSRQASVSPLRTRISGSGLSPRWIRGAKSAELLTSRNASPGGGKLSRRTLSKEWHVVTLTTREEITTTTRPRSTVNKISPGKYSPSVEPVLSLNGVSSLGTGGQETQNLRTLSDGSQFRFGSSGVRSRVVTSDVERNLDERNRLQGADWNTESNDRLGVESEVKNPSHGQIERVLETEIKESYQDIDDQTRLAVTNDERKDDSGDTSQTAGIGDSTRTNGEIHAAGSKTIGADQLTSTSTFSPSVTRKTVVHDGKGMMVVSDELSSDLSFSGFSEQPEQQRVLDGISSSSSSAQNPDEVAFWTIITEALSEMMKEVQLAENNANDTTTTTMDDYSATKNDTRDNVEPEQGQNSTVVLSAETDSLQIVEASDAENVLTSDSLEDNCEATEDPVSVDIDALVQALLYFANEGGGAGGEGDRGGATVESTKVSGTQAAPPENAQSSASKESTQEVVTTIDERLLPSASCCWPQDPLKETAITSSTASRSGRTGSDEAAILETFCSGGVFPRRTDAWDGIMVEEDKNSADSLLFPKLTESTEDRSAAAVFDDDFSFQNIDADSLLEIREESDTLDSSDQVEEMHSSFSGSQTGDKVTPEGTSHSDSVTEESSACSDDTVRRRTVSKQDGAPEVRSMRRESDSGDLFSEKAFLESLFSSLGTIIFLLLAALIFHVFTRIVEHEL